MMKILSLFCSNCNALLVSRNHPLGFFSCPSCGLVVSKEERTLQKISIPPESFLGLTGKVNQLWAWGIQHDQAWILQIPPLNSKVQAIFRAPNNWQVSGLAITEKVLIFAPWEPNPPGNSKAFVGIHPETGEVLWEYATSGFMFTSPAADEELACAVDSHGTLVTVYSSTGKAAWTSFPNLGDFPHRRIPPLLSQNHILAVESDAHGAGLVAFHRDTGEIAWEFIPPENAKVDFAPALGNDSAFVLANEWLYRVSLVNGTGTRLSRSERKSSQGWYFAPPVVDEDCIYLLEANYPGGKPGYALQARDSVTGRLRWQLLLNDRPYKPSTISRKYVYFVDRVGNLFCLNKQDGQIVWQEHLSAEPADVPVILENSIFVLTKDATLHAIKLSTPTADISQPPAFYEKRGEWALAAGAYLANSQPFEAGLSLLKINDYRQANLAFNMMDDAEGQIRKLLNEFTYNKNDSKAGALSESWGMILLERLGEQSQGNIQVAEWFQQAAENFMLANQTQNALRCREQAAKVMETPKIKLEVIAGEDARWVVNESVLLQVKVANEGYGPARRVTIRIGGNIKKPYPSKSFVDLARDQPQEWNNIPVTPKSSGIGLLEFTLEYESYRIRQTAQTKFTHPIQVEKNQEIAVLKVLKESPSLHIEKFISPGAIQNDFQIIEPRGIAIGDHAQSQSTFNQPSPEVSDSTKENQMDPATLVVSALIGGLTAGLTDTAKAATKDMYEALKARLMKKTETNQDAQDAIAKVERQPESRARQELLKEELGKLELDKDDELLKLAQSLLDALRESGDKAGKYKVNIKNGQGIVVGDNSNVTQNFGDAKGKKQK